MEHSCKVPAISERFKRGNVVAYEDLPSDIELVIIYSFDCAGHRLDDKYSRRGLLYYATTCRRLRDRIMFETKNCIMKLEQSQREARIKDGWIPTSPKELFKICQHLVTFDHTDPEVSESSEEEESGESDEWDREGDDWKFNKMNTSLYKDTQFLFDAHNPCYMLPTRLVLKGELLHASLGNSCSTTGMLYPLGCKRGWYCDDMDQLKLELPQEDGIEFRVERKLTPFIANELPVESVLLDERLRQRTKTRGDLWRLGFKDKSVDVSDQFLFPIILSCASKNEYMIELMLDEYSSGGRGRYEFYFKKTVDGELAPIGEDLLRIYQKPRAIKE